MKSELHVLKENKMWKVVNLPKRNKAVGYKWVNKVKFKTDGLVERYKVRLVVKGYMQREGLNYHEIFSLIAKIVSMPILLALAMIKR